MIIIIIGGTINQMVMIIINHVNGEDSDETQFF
jgi:hypothetical protein